MKESRMLRTLKMLLCGAAFTGALAAVPAPAAPTPPPQPGYSGAAPTPTPNPELMARAKSWFEQLQTGKVDRSQLATATNGALTDSQLAQAKTMIGALGAPVSFVQKQGMSQGGFTYAIYLLTFADGSKIDFAFGLDAQGKVAGLRLMPAQ